VCTSKEIGQKKIYTIRVISDMWQGIKTESFVLFPFFTWLPTFAYHQIDEIQLQLKK
jgi:hypothetical protein